MPATWDRARYARAAYLLGRLSVSPRWRELADVRQHPFTSATTSPAGCSIQVLPMLRDEGIWQHPLVAAPSTPTLRDRLLRGRRPGRRSTSRSSALPFA